MRISKTKRGFKYFRMKDSEGQFIRILESSQVGVGLRIWLFCDLDGNGKQKDHHLGRCNPCAPYLTRNQAKRLAEALIKLSEIE